LLSRPAQQTNRVDCGVYVCTYAAHISDGLTDMSFTPADARQYRDVMALQVLQRSKANVLPV
jgi:Ulp1 family protease